MCSPIHICKDQILSSTVSSVNFCLSTGLNGCFAVCKQFIRPPGLGTEWFGQVGGQLISPFPSTTVFVSFFQSLLATTITAATLRRRLNTRSFQPGGTTRHHGKPPASLHLNSHVTPTYHHLSLSFFSSLSPVFLFIPSPSFVLSCWEKMGAIDYVNFRPSTKSCACELCALIDYYRFSITEQLDNNATLQIIMLDTVILAGTVQYCWHHSSLCTREVRTGHQSSGVRTLQLSYPISTSIHPYKFSNSVRHFVFFCFWWRYFVFYIMYSIDTRQFGCP